MNSELKQKLMELFRVHGTVEADAPMAHYTTFETGGPAEVLVMPEDEDSAAAVLAICHDHGVGVTVIGGGSNLLVGDRGIPGVVLRIDARDRNGELFTVNSDGSVTAHAGMSKESWIKTAIERGFGGVLFAAGIPGTVGGGIVMNGGTYMGCFADVLTSVDTVDFQGRRHIINIDPEAGAYRSMGIPRDRVVLSGTFSLPVSSDVQGQLQEYREIIDDRWSKHPMEFPSAGSVFKNPQGHSSWKLVDDAGLKGCTMGGAMVSEKHTNFIINAGGATSADIKNLVEHIQITVAEKWGISLETEIRMIGLF